MMGVNQSWPSRLVTALPSKHGHKMATVLASRAAVQAVGLRRTSAIDLVAERRSKSTGMIVCLRVKDLTYGHLLPKQRVAGSIPVSRSRYDFPDSRSLNGRPFHGSLGSSPIWFASKFATSDTKS
jgi:hypothetical protein